MKYLWPLADDATFSAHRLDGCCCTGIH